MTQTVLITGGLGYIGGRVALALADQETWNLRLTTRQPNSVPDDLRATAEIVELDLLAANEAEGVCRGVHTVVHLAAQNEVDAKREPQQALLINGMGTLKLLQGACAAGVQRFIYFSTAHVYCAPLAGRITEETITRPAHPYAITHHVAEDFVLAASDERLIEGVVIRLSNGFGCPAHAAVNRWTLITNDLCKQAVTAGKLVLKTHGTQSRDFITLSDVARATGHFLKAPWSDLGNGLFNLGGECVLRIIDVAERIAERCEKVLGFRPPIERPPFQEGSKFPSLDYRIDKLKATGFALQGDFDAEIDATLRLCHAAFGFA